MKILAVIVLYGQSLYDTNTYKSLLRDNIEIEALFIYDNSPFPQNSVEDFDMKRLLYFHDASNPGLSKAYNLSAKYAKENNIDWILLLDQDTTFPKNAMRYYLDAMNKYSSSISLFAPKHQLQSGLFLSPVRQIHRFSTLAKHTPPEGLASFDFYVPINSGLMISVREFFNVGGYNEKVKLDFSDFQFIERFKKKNKTFCILNFVCKQNYSDEETDFYKVVKRFEIFCDCAKNCEKDDLIDKIDYFLVTLKRTCSLSFRYKSFTFFKCYIKKYI